MTDDHLTKGYYINIYIEPSWNDVTSLLLSYMLFLAFEEFAAARRKSGGAYVDVTARIDESYMIRSRSSLVLRRYKICWLLQTDAGVSPISDRKFLSAPFFKSKTAISKYPSLHAQCRAVLEKHEWTKRMNTVLEVSW